MFKTIGVFIVNFEAILYSSVSIVDSEQENVSWEIATPTARQCLSPANVQLDLIVFPYYFVMK